MSDSAKGASEGLLFCHKCKRRSIHRPDGATAQTGYVCADCAPLGGLRKDAFRLEDEDLRHASYVKRASHVADVAGPSRVHRGNGVARLLADVAPERGFRIFTKMAPRADAPDWALDDKFLKLLATRYARNNSGARRVAAVYWYYRCGMEAKEIARELGMSTNGVEVLLNRVIRFAEKNYDPLSLRT